MSHVQSLSGIWKTYHNYCCSWPLAGESLPLQHGEMDAFNRGLGGGYTLSLSRCVMAFFQPWSALQTATDSCARTKSMSGSGTPQYSNAPKNVKKPAISRRGFFFSE